jgi:hypothetical protein
MYDMPTQQINAGSMTPVQAPEFQNYTGKQIEQIGQTASTLGQTAFKIGTEIQNKYDDARTKDLFNQAASDIDQVRNDYLTKPGKDAVDTYAVYQQKVDDVLKSYADKAENPVQRGMFMTSGSTMARSALSSMNNHQLQQLHEYDLGETKTAVKTKAQAAIAMQGTPKEQIFLDATIAQANQLADMQGYAADSEQRKALISDTHDAIVKGVVDNMLAAGRPSQAKEYLASATKDGRVSEFMHTSLEKLVSTDSAKDTALKLSLSLKGSESSQVSQINEMFKNGKLSQEERDFTVQYVEHSFAQRKAADQDYKKTVLGNAQDWILKNPGLPISQMPTALYNAAKSEGGLASLDALAGREGKPAEQTKALVVRGQLLQLASQDPDEFIKKFNETGFTGEMDIGVAGIKEMQNIATQMIQGKGTYSNGFDSRILQDAIPAALLKTANKDQKDAFVALQAEAIANWKKNNPGKLPTVEDQKRVAQEANTSWVQIGTLWNSQNIPGYTVKSKALTNTVPTNFYNGMKSAGATDDEILAAWNLKQGKK